RISRWQHDGIGSEGRSATRPSENLANRWQGLHDTASLTGNEGSMRPIQPPRLKLRAARKGRNAIWVIKDREREISTGWGQSERAKAEIALAEYITKTRLPSFGDGHPAEVLIGDCLSVYCEKHGPAVARPDGLALEVERLAEYWGDKFVAEVTEEAC